MKKLVISLVLLIMMLSVATAQAISTRASTVLPSLSFSGNLATCVIEIVADSSNDDIRVEAELLKDCDSYRSWTGSGTGDLHFSRVATVTKGHTYTFTADITIDGKEYSIMPITKDY